MNKEFKKISFSFQGIILAAVLSLAFFLLGFERFKTYESDVTVLVIPKSIVAVGQKDQIINNLVEFPKTLAFYDKLLKDNPSFEDSAVGQNSQQRKEIWNRMISTDISNRSGSMFVISIFAADEADSKLIASKTSRALFDFTGNYYNVKDDIDLRIIEGPITKTVFFLWPLVLLFSIAAGSLISIAIGRLSFFRQKAAGFQDIFKNNPLQNLNKTNISAPSMPIEALDKLYETESSIDMIAKNKTQPIEEAGKDEQPVISEVSEEVKTAPAEEIVHLQEIASRSVYPNFPEMPVHGAPKSAAPDNLPIADFDDESEALENETSASVNIPEEPEMPVEKNHEPTEQQLKDRLNQLLKGDLK